MSAFWQGFEKRAKKKNPVAWYKGKKKSLKFKAAKGTGKALWGLAGLAALATYADKKLGPRSR